MSYKNVYVDNGGTTAGYDPTLVVPSNTLENDFMVAVLWTSDNNPDISPTPPSTETWTLAEPSSMPIDGTAAVSNPAAWIYYKVASADDEANAGSKTYQWVFGGAEEQVGVLILMDPAQWGQFAKTEVTGTGTTIDAPSVTTTVPNELVWHCAFKDGGVAFSGFPTGDATRFNEIWGATSDAGAAGGMVEEEYASTGPTGTKQYTLAINERNSFTFSCEPISLATIEQEGFRFYADGTESGSTALEAQDTDITINRETTFQERVLLNATGDPDSAQFRLEYKESSDGASEWRPVPLEEDMWIYTTSVATTSGTSVTLTSGIPSTAREIEILLNGVSTNTASQPPVLRLGDAGGIETTGYTSIARVGANTQAQTAYFQFFRAADYTAAEALSGIMRLARWDDDAYLWIMDCLATEAAQISHCTGFKATSEVLTTLQLTTPGGTATFDAGSARVRYR